MERRNLKLNTNGTISEAGGFKCSNRYQSAIGPDLPLEGPGAVKQPEALSGMDAKKGPGEVGALGYESVNRLGAGGRTSYWFAVETKSG